MSQIAHGIIFVTGVIIWIILGLFFAYLIWRAIRSIFTAGSWFRWYIATMKRNLPIKWHRMPLIFIRRWWEFLWSSENSLRWFFGASYWKGIGNWKVGDGSDCFEPETTDDQQVTTEETPNDKS